MINSNNKFPLSLHLSVTIVLALASKATHHTHYTTYNNILYKNYFEAEPVCLNKILLELPVTISSGIRNQAIFDSFSHLYKKKIATEFV